MLKFVKRKEREAKIDGFLLRVSYFRGVEISKFLM